MAFEIISDKPINGFNSISKEIVDKTQEFLGQLGVAKAGIQILPKCWNPELQRGLIKVNHKYTDELKASLAFVKKINNQKTIIKSIGVSGIIKKAKERYLS